MRKKYGNTKYYNPKRKSLGKDAFYYGLFFLVILIIAAGFFKNNFVKNNSELVPPFISGNLPETQNSKTPYISNTNGDNVSPNDVFVVDGDTVRIKGERIRLIGIDAPEMPGKCKGNRVCAPGNPFVSKANLENAIKGEIKITRYGNDKYGRTLATISANGSDLSCQQINSGNAIYVAKWDNAGLPCR